MIASGPECMANRHGVGVDRPLESRSLARRRTIDSISDWVHKNALLLIVGGASLYGVLTGRVGVLPAAIATGVAYGIQSLFRGK